MASRSGCRIALILIVDDVSANRAFLVDLLREHGHSVAEASNGREGLAAVVANRPDLVITDVLMPVMDGYEFVRQLRLDATTNGIPVLFYTAHYGVREARTLALTIGVAGVLTKPPIPATLLEIISRVLAGEPGSGPPEPSPVSDARHREHLRLLTVKMAERAEDLRADNARLRALVNIGLDFASDRDRVGRLEDVCGAVLDLFAATYVTAGLVDRRDGKVQRLAVSGMDHPRWLAVGDDVPGMLGTVLAERRATRGDNPDGLATALGLPTGHPDVHAYLAAPILSAAQVYGWICLVGNEGQTFTEDDEELVVALAATVGRVRQLEDEIAERHQAEADLRVERDRAQRYLDTAEVILLALDREGRVTLLNRKGCEVLGWVDRDIVGRDWVETCIPEGARTAHREFFGHVGSGGLPLHENAVVTKSGQTRLIEWHNTVLHDEHGIDCGTFSSGTDVTSRRVLEAQYQQAQKMDAVGRLAGGVAHDFNNLLTVILVYCELQLEELPEDSACHGYAKEVQRAGKSATELTHQLLAFSRKEVVAPARLDLNELVDGLQSMLRRLIREDVQLVLALEPSVATIMADRGQVQQIVVNLAVNARDAMAEGGTLTIATRAVSLDAAYADTHLGVVPGPYIALTVTDTGAGMSDAVLERLFEPFFTTKEAGKGTGLGLATVQGIVTQSGGSITVATKLTKGTTFTVFFPLLAEDAPATALPVA